MIPFSEKALTAGLGVLYHLLYHQLAWGYDLVAATVSLGLWQSWVQATLPYLNGPCILELGYGPGHLQTEMRARGLISVGLDASPQMAEIARDRLRKIGLKACIAIGYAQILPFSSTRIDQVVATFPSEYILDPLSLAEIYRVLKPGGELITIPFAWQTGENWRSKLSARLLRVSPGSTGLEDRFLQPFINAGFRCSTIRIELPSSALMIIKGVKDMKS